MAGPVCRVWFPGRQSRICCYADWVMLEANIMSHFVRTFQRLIQALQMGHRLPLSRGHFNNPHLQYSTCCLHRDNSGTQKPTRTTQGRRRREAESQAPASPHLILHGKWVCSGLICAWRWGSPAAFFKASREATLECAACPLALSLVRHSGKVSQLQVICASFCIKQLTWSNRLGPLGVNLALSLWLRSPAPSPPSRARICCSTIFLTNGRLRRQPQDQRTERQMRGTHSRCL